MASTCSRWLAAALVTLAVAASANAFPPFPPFQCPWHQDKDCPRPSYCCLHYWTPSVYTCRAYHTPPSLVYGCPTDPAFSGFRINKYPCRVTSSAEQAAEYANMRRFDPGAASAPELPSVSETSKQSAASVAQVGAGASRGK